MKVPRKNIITALFLLVVFSLNTVVGFACSIGIDMGYNSSHHQHGPSNVSVKNHSHTSGNNHATGTANNQCHQHKHPASKATGKNTQHDCCANAVTRFIQLDKSVVKSNFDLQLPTLLVAFTSVFIQPLLNPINIVNKSVHLTTRRSSSIYDTGIRIAIQSFQI